MILPCSLGWPWTHNPPVFVLWVPCSYLHHLLNLFFYVHLPGSHLSLRVFPPLFGDRVSHNSRRLWTSRWGWPWIPETAPVLTQPHSSPPTKLFNNHSFESIRYLIIIISSSIFGIHYQGVIFWKYYFKIFTPLLVSLCWNLRGYWNGHVYHLHGIAIREYGVLLQLCLSASVRSALLSPLPAGTAAQSPVVSLWLSLGRAHTRESDGV